MLEEGAFSVSRLICMSMIMILGTKAFAANQIANQIEEISVMLSVGLGITTTALVGKSIGEGNIKLSKRYAYYSCFICLSISLMFSAIFLVFPTRLSKIFYSKEEIEGIYLAASCLLIGAVEQPFIAISSVFSGALKGIGYSKIPFMISYFTAWFIRIPLIYYYIYLLNKPIVYVWWITSLQWAIDGILMFISFKKNINMIK